MDYLTDGGPYGRLAAPRSVACDGQGRAYVLDAHGVHVFDQAGRHLGLFGQGDRATLRQGSAQALFVTGNRLWVCDQRVLRHQYDLDGRLRSVLRTGGRFFCDNAGHTYVHTPASGQLAVSDPGFSLPATLGEMPCQLLEPCAAVMRPNGTHYIADGPAHRVLTFDQRGRHLGRLRSQLHRPRGLALSGEWLFVLGDLSDRIDACFVKVFDGEDRPIAEFGRTGQGVPEPGRVDWAAGIAANQDFLLVCDRAGNRVVRVPVAAFGVGQEEAGVIRYRRRGESVRHSSARYDIHVAGTLGPRNTARGGHNWTPRFQPNAALTIRNSGNVAVRNPRLAINGKGPWSSGPDLAAQAVGQWQTDEEKAFACWDFVRSHMMPGVSWDDFFAADPDRWSLTRFLNAFGSGACGSYNWVVSRVGMLAGLRAAAGNLSDGSHGVSQLYYDGRGRFFDGLISHHPDPRTPIGLFFRKLDNQTVASYEDLVHDHYLVTRAGQSAGFLASMFGYHDGWQDFSADYRDPSDMGLLLRPGEHMTLQWDFLGQYIGTQEPTDAITNGEVVYHPRLADGTYRAHLVSESYLACTADDGGSPSLHLSRSGIDYMGRAVFRVSSPYPIVGGQLTGVFKRTSPNDRLWLSLSADGQQWHRLWQMEDVGVHQRTVQFGRLEEMRRFPLCYEVLVQVQIGSTGPVDGVGVDDLAIHVDFQAYAPSLPGLEVGTNSVSYADDTAEPHEVTIEHCWKESARVTPPGAVPAPVSPAPGQECHGAGWVFRWQPAPAGSAAVSDYQFLLSDRPGSAWALAPCFETWVGSGVPELPVPGPSYFLPGRSYYWRVRAVDEWGVLGPWSNRWTFVYCGPGRPVELRYQVEGRRIRLSWTPNPEGTRPARYQVFVSDERGFEPSDHPYPGKDRYADSEGVYPILPANLLAVTEETSLVVVDEASPHPLANRVYYRVVAVDADGIASTPSEYVEVHHPFIYSAPVEQAGVGKEYAYQVKTTRSLGDLQWNIGPPKPAGMAFLYADDLEFSLASAPDWLSIDSKNGLVTGAPPVGAAGPHEIVVQADAYDTSPDQGPVLRGRAEQRYVLQVDR